MNFPLTGIALSGKAGSGKSYLAERIAQACPANANVFPFAKPLKDDVERRYGLVKGMPGAREKLLERGAELRAENPLWFVERQAEVVQHALHYGVTPIIDDLRFLDELTFCREWRMFVVRVDASLRDRQERFRVRGQDDSICTSTDRSEVELDGARFDLRVFNWQHGNTDYLVRQILREAMGERWLSALAA